MSSYRPARWAWWATMAGISATGSEQCIERRLVQPSALPPEQLPGIASRTSACRNMNSSSPDSTSPPRSTSRAGPGSARPRSRRHGGEEVERHRWPSTAAASMMRWLLVEAVDLASQHLCEAPRQRLLARAARSSPSGRRSSSSRKNGLPPVRLCSAARTGTAPGGRCRASITRCRPGPALETDAGDAVTALEPGRAARRPDAGGSPPRGGRCREEPRPAQVGDPLEQRRALGVGPVEVLEDDHRWPSPTRPFDQSPAVCRRSTALRLGSARAASRPRRSRCAARSRPAGPRTGRHSDPGSAPPTSVTTSAGSASRSSPHQAGPADARLAADDHDLGLLVRHQTLELAQLRARPIMAWLAPSRMVRTR